MSGLPRVERATQVPTAHLAPAAQDDDSSSSDVQRTRAAYARGSVAPGTVILGDAMLRLRAKLEDDTTSPFDADRVAFNLWRQSHAGGDVDTYCAYVQTQLVNPPAAPSNEPAPAAPAAGGQTSSLPHVEDEESDVSSSCATLDSFPFSEGSQASQSEPSAEPVQEEAVDI